MQEQPLVSCIMPTYNRREFVPHAIRYFKRQTYPNKELIILDDGTDCIRDLIPDEKSIRYYRYEDKITLGEKLNLACEYAEGTIIVNWDDDDWYASHRISYQVSELLKHGTVICGINTLLYLDFNQSEGYKYIYPSNQKTWLLGSSLCYTKEFWKTHRFAHINVGMDGLFVWSTTDDKITVLSDYSFSVHMIHSENVSPKQTKHAWWHKYSTDSIYFIMGEDSKFYQDGFVKKKGIVPTIETNRNLSPTEQTEPVKNIFACLVHEKKECIIDLVRNLHYHNPESIIILYNGGTDKLLLENTFDYSRFNVVFHPKPTPQKHGYLHGFALDCFEFATHHYDFDTLTIVDSDQISLRSEYSSFLAHIVKKSENIGMLSSNPQVVTESNKTNYVAMQAHKEWELWKAFVQSFPNGEKCFVHWTFWPGTVFTMPAIKDILKLFKSNSMLQQIMKETKIWAIEEVLFPTLVKLLGYTIIQNPCDFNYIKYKVAFGLADIKRAVTKPNAFWMHPVERSYENPVRKYNREYFHHYVRENNSSSHPEESPSSFSFLRTIREASKIEGWLSDKEADLLISIVLKSCLKSKDPVVELGCYQGKATFVMGKVMQAFNPDSRIYAIDSHNGILGAADQGLNFVKPSFENFKRNIHEAGLDEIVIPIQDYSYKVNWKKSISVLLIDGLHDYPNVARDFEHYAQWVKPGGYILFHDYAEYYPGVVAFVNEIIGSGSYNKIKKEDSLIVVKKAISEPSGQITNQTNQKVLKQKA